MFNAKDHMMNLKGKDYLQVMWRLVWFREDKPLWCINTEAHSIDENGAVFKAEIYDENGEQKSSGYGSESKKDFTDFIEKAETKAIGRALAMLGYGTQFAPELDEGERIVDSPVEKKPEEDKYITEKQQKELYEYCKQKWGGQAANKFFTLTGKAQTKLITKESYETVKKKLEDAE